MQLSPQQAAPPGPTQAAFFEAPSDPVYDCLFVYIGANPLVSNGSLMTAPNVRRRLKTLRERGGRVVVIDPRRTETAAVAEHVFIRPGTDVLMLLSLVNVLFEENLVRPGRLGEHLAGERALRAAAGRLPAGANDRGHGRRAGDGPRAGLCAREPRTCHAVRPRRRAHPGVRRACYLASAGGQRGRLTIAVLRRLASPLAVPGSCAVRLARPAPRSP
jgi:Molybdopterin oxidoreductase